MCLNYENYVNAVKNGWLLKKIIMKIHSTQEKPHTKIGKKYKSSTYLNYIAIVSNTREWSIYSKGLITAEYN